MNWDPTKWEADPNKWGTAGLIWNGPVDPRTLTNGSGGEGFNFDPRYMRRVQDYSSEGGGQSSYEFTDHYNKLFDGGNKVQIRDVKRLIDPNAASWGGDEVGWLTSKDNYKSDDDWLDKNFFTLATLPLLGMTGLHIAGVPQGSIAEAWSHITGGGTGLGGDAPYGTEIANSYAPNANPTAFYEPLTNPLSSGAPYGTNALEAAEWFGGPEAATNPSPGLFGSSPPAGILGSATNGLGGLLQGALKNPLQALGLAQMFGGLLNPQGGGSTPGGAPGGPEGSFNLPKSNRGPWTPNPFTSQQIQNFKYIGGR